MHRWLAGTDIDVGRRHVAVLFADFVGLPELVESIGAELAFRTVAPVVDRLIAAVSAYGGVVQHIVGGASMSVFGLDPRCGEEVAQAVSAGIALTSMHADPGALQVHVGIECGEVVISRSWEPAGFAVWGNTVTVPGVSARVPILELSRSVLVCPHWRQDRKARSSRRPAAWLDRERGSQSGSSGGALLVR
jgi:class 3 adenylate cyclase